LFEIEANAYPFTWKKRMHQRSDALIAVENFQDAFVEMPEDDDTNRVPPVHTV